MPSRSLPSKVSVLIIGGGPTGLTLACTLINKGVPYSSILIVDRESATHQKTRRHQSRATAIHSRTLECLEEGVDDSTSPSPKRPTDTDPLALEPLDETIKSTVQTILDRSRILDELRIRDPKKSKILLTTSLTLLESETKYPFLTIHPQGNTEAILEARLNTLGGELQREWSFESFTTDDETKIGGPVKVKLLHSSGEFAEVETTILVGADGSRSKVRTASQIEFHGYSYPHTLALGDVRFKSPDWPYVSAQFYNLKTEYKYFDQSGFEKIYDFKFTEPGWKDYEGSQFWGSNGWLLFVPLPDKSVRIVADFESSNVPKTDHKPGEYRKGPTQAELQEFVNHRGPKVVSDDEPNKIIEVKWSSTFQISHRIVPSFIKGPVCLIGDAAHIHAPAGGQGLNIGVQDAVSLGITLSEFFHSSSTKTPESNLLLTEKLNQWSSKRHEFATQVLKISDNLFRTIVLRNRFLIWIRNLFYPILGMFPKILKNQLKKIAGLNYR
ncbi:FAD-binding monooxygenase [Melampsora americana]|nr:FAD-binding monooxygenase [Melampsora americana]